jgi:hypothetical protein
MAWRKGAAAAAAAAAACWSRGREGGGREGGRESRWNEVVRILFIYLLKK